MRLIFGSKILLSLITGGCLCVLSQSPSFVPMPVVLASQAFSSLESNLDSNGRDLLAISYALKSFYKSVIKRKLVKLFTRSRNAAVISNKDSTSLRLRLKLNGSPGLSMCKLTPSVV